jgi:chromosome segregation ATPase
MRTNTRKLLRLGLALAVWAILSGCVSASEGRRMRQDIEALDARFAELNSSLENQRGRLNELIEAAERDVASLQEALESAQGILRRSTADFGGQLGAMESELQQLRGLVEQTDFRINQLQEQINLLIEDIDLRLGN